jgi:Fanconi anemia group M protein
VFVAHPRIAPDRVARRGYQEAIAAECLARNTLVVLPTGMGKTVIALLVLAERLREGGKAIFLAPTKPLVDQHARFLGEHLVGLDVRALTGEVPPADRAEAWAAGGVVCSTPQVLQNDLARGGAPLEGVQVLVLDEAHRAVGEYAYAAIARAYREAEPKGRLLGMTASPGAQPEKIAEVMENLGIQGIEIRTEDDPDVAPFVQPIRMEWLEVAMPPSVERIAQLLRAALGESMAELQRAGVLRAGQPSTRDLIEAQRRLGAQASQGEAREMFHLLSALARALKLNHAVEMCETQGLGALRTYVERLREDPSRAAKAILRDARVGEALRLLAQARVEHPKLRRVALLLQEQLRVKPQGKAIVFTHYRDTSEILQEELAKVEGIKPVRFVGQATKGEDKGLSQRQQQAILEAFKAGEHNVLIATSVAEEGLDIPSTDLVIFYEPVPSEIRSIQRRGRTGRHSPGRVMVLVTKGTRDVASYWTARRKERAMKLEVGELRQRFAHVNASWERPAGQATLASFEPPTAGEVRVDHRRANSALAAALRERGITVVPDLLPGATFAAGAIGVRVIEAEELATPAGRVRVEGEVRALQRFGRRAVLLQSGADVAPGTVRAWEQAGLTVRQAKDPAEATAALAELLGVRA